MLTREDSEERLKAAEPMARDAVDGALRAKLNPLDQNTRCL